MATEQDRTPLLPLTPPSATHQTTVILCDYGGTVLSQRTRTSGSGKTGVRMTLDIKATPLLANLNGVEMGRGPAEAIRAILEDQSLNITEIAAPATLKFREKMKRAYNGQSKSSGSVLRRGATVSVQQSDAAYARARYSGGRTGGMEPGTSVRIGVDSGRLARGWFVRQNPKEGAWTINVPANRFDPSTWGGDLASLQAWITRYVSLMPALRDPRSILTDKRFKDAVLKSPPVVKMTRSGWQAAKDWIAEINRAVGGSANVVRLLGG